MTPVDCYRTYLAFKQHFSKVNYDYFKYQGKSKASPEAFYKRKDRYFFEKMSRQKSDQEIKDFAFKELSDLNKKNEINEKKLKIYLLPKDEADTKNAIIEIRAGTGGLEEVYSHQIYLKCMKK